MRQGHMCMTSYYHPIYHTPLQSTGWVLICVALDWLVAWLGVIGLKKAVISPCVSWILARKAPTIPLPCIVGQSVAYSSNGISPLFLKKLHNDIVLFKFHSLMTQLAKFFLLEAFCISTYPQSLNWCEEIHNCSHCAGPDDESILQCV